MKAEEYLNPDLNPDLMLWKKGDALPMGVGYADVLDAYITAVAELRTLKTMAKTTPSSGKVADHLMNRLNGGMNTPEFLDVIKKSHPTLQQSLMRLIWEVIKAYAEKFRMNHYDGRNEASCRFADAVERCIYTLEKETGVSYARFPFI